MNTEGHLPVRPTKEVSRSFQTSLLPGMKQIVLDFSVQFCLEDKPKEGEGLELKIYIGIDLDNIPD